MRVILEWRRWIQLHGVLLLAGVLTPILVACDGGDGGDSAAETPVSLQIQEAPEVYFIIVNTAKLEAWGTGALSREQFDALVLPSPWIRDEPENFTVMNSVWLRSPAAIRDGPTEKQIVADVEFEHIVDIRSLESIDEAGLLSAAYSRKYHQMTLPGSASNAARLLTAPDGDKYFLVNRQPDRTEEIGPVPDGWSHRMVPVPEDLVLTFRGNFVNIEDTIGDLYQGPVDIVFGIGGQLPPCWVPPKPESTMNCTAICDHLGECGVPEARGACIESCLAVAPYLSAAPSGTAQACMLDVACDVADTFVNTLDACLVPVLFDGTLPRIDGNQENCDAVTPIVNTCDADTSFASVCTGFAAAFSQESMDRIGSCAGSRCADLRACLSQANCWFEATNPNALPQPEEEVQFDQ